MEASSVRAALRLSQLSSRTFLLSAPSRRTEGTLDKLPYLMSIIVVEVEWTGGREPSEPEYDGELVRTSALFPL